MSQDYSKRNFHRFHVFYFSYY